MRLSSVRSVLAGLLALSVFIYPLVVYVFIDTVDLVWFGVLLVCLVALRLWSLLRLNAVTFALLIFGIAFLVILKLTGNAMVLQFYPTIVSLVLLTTFALTLFRPPSMIERFAVRMGMERDPPHIAYTRVCTMVWCGFFIVNAIVSAGITLTGTMAAWALYNGLLSYVLIGLLFGAEYLYRQYHFRHHRIHGEVS